MQMANFPVADRPRKRNLREKKDDKAMRLLVILLLLATVVAFGIQVVSSKELKQTTNVEPKAHLRLSISSDKQKYKRHGKIRITATLTNADYLNDILIYGKLGWGYSASLTYTIRDVSGKRIEPNVLADDLTFPILRDDTSSFVKLLPRHFLGTYFLDDLDQLSLRKPGRYTIFVEYHSPISTKDVNLSNFWSKEDGVIRSNVVRIEVLP